MLAAFSKAARIEKKLKGQEEGSQLLVNSLYNQFLRITKKSGKKTSPEQAKKQNSLSPLISPVLTPPSTHKRWQINDSLDLQINSTKRRCFHRRHTKNANISKK